MAHRDFLHDYVRRSGLSPEPDIAEIFERVRVIPYAVTNHRSARSVIETGRGSCSGKHVLLSMLLQRFGHSSEIITVKTRIDPKMMGGSFLPRSLRALAAGATVTDFHHFVRMRIGGCPIDLDVTWDDSLSRVGVTVNSRWDGQSNTRIAFAPEEVVGSGGWQDLATFKQALIDSMGADDRRRRQQFFDGFTSWLDEVVRRTGPSDGSMGKRPAVESRDTVEATSCAES